MGITMHQDVGNAIFYNVEESRKIPGSISLTDYILSSSADR